MGAITFKQVLRQLKADLIGKDSYRGVTLTYSWLANQFGHFSLGFIPAFILYLFLKDTPKYNHTIWSSLFISVIWLLFELYNFLGPLLTKKMSKSKTLFLQEKKNYIFKPKWLNVAFDTFTDLCFFWLGAFFYSFIVQPTFITAIIVGILFTIILFSSKYWFLTKMYQMYARYPFQMRLSQWNFSINDNNQQKITAFLKEDKTNRHLLIFGPQKCGKTSLGVALSNEFSINQNKCLYTSAIKLYGSFFKEENMNDTDKIWSWKEADLLIIDDVNPGDPIPVELVNPKEFLQFVDVFSDSINKKNRDLLKNKKVIWILGGKTNQKEILQNSWKNMLLEIEIPKEKITIINLIH